MRDGPALMPVGWVPAGQLAHAEPDRLDQSRISGQEQVRHQRVRDDHMGSEQASHQAEKSSDGGRQHDSRDQALAPCAGSFPQDTLDEQPGQRTADEEENQSGTKSDELKKPLPTQTSAADPPSCQLSSTTRRSRSRTSPVESVIIHWPMTSYLAHSRLGTRRSGGRIP